MPRSPTNQIAELQRTLGEAIRARDKATEIDTLLQIARVSMEAGDLGLANMHFDLAAKAIGRSGIAKDRLHEALGGRGLMYRRAKRYDRALASYEKAAAAAQEHASAQAVAHWVGRQGAVLREMGDVERARTAVTRARDLYLALGDAGLAGLAEQEGVLGMLAHDGGNEDAAHAAYRRAAETVRPCGPGAATSPISSAGGAATEKPGTGTRGR
jgi:tetratricopeptide (TPR) repeat protein